MRGQSAGATWAIDSQYPEARLSVGSSPGAGWSITGVGVQPIHFELFWDGKSLWVADTYRAGGVVLDGKPVSEWVQVRSRSELKFGACVLRIETDQARPAEMASLPGSATRVTLSPDFSQTGSMRISSLDALGGVELEGEKTRVAVGPSEAADSGAWGDLAGESTRIAPELADLPDGLDPTVPPGHAKPPTPSQAPAGIMRPRLGAAAPARPSPGAPALPAPAEATKIAILPEAAAPVLGPPASGGLGGAMFGGAAASPAIPSGLAPPAPPSFGAPPAPPPGPPPVVGGFAAPPSFDQAGAPPAAGGAAKPEKGKQALPTRTWILLSVTVLAAVGLMMMEPPAPAEPAPAARPAGVPGPLPAAGQPNQGAADGTGQPVQAQAGVAQDGVVQPAPAQVVPSAGTVEPGSAQVGAVEPVPAQVAPAVAPPAAPGEAPTGPTPDRLAADLVIMGRYDDALPRYRELAAARPDRPEYLQMVRILERRVASRCQGGVGPDGRPCTP